MAYTASEYCDMHYLYGASLGNAAEARRLYAATFPNRQLPSDKVFTRVHSRLRETGSFEVNKRDTGRPRTVRNVEFEEQVLEMFEDDPRLSVRSVARQTNTSSSSVWRILKEENLYPFHLQKVQSLLPEDFVPRVNCVRWFLEQDIVDPNFLSKVLFTDEATFTRDGIFNSRNSHVWALDNPHEIAICHHQHRFSVNVWSGILNNHVIGPYILPIRLTSPSYLVFLRDILPELLEDIPLANLENVWFQHDGAPAHFGQVVKDHLNIVYGHQWIGRGGPVSWPPRSPDLNPLDFFFWGRMKELVYKTPVEDEHELVARIVAASAEIQDDPNVFQNVRESMHKRCRACNAAGGQNFEQLLKTAMVA